MEILYVVMALIISIAVRVYLHKKYKDLDSEFECASCIASVVIGFMWIVAIPILIIAYLVDDIGKVVYDLINKEK